MTSSIEQELRAFATTLLERRSALVEWAAGDEGTAIVPPELSASLGADGELLRLSTRPGGKGWCLSLATDFLDTASLLLEQEPRVGTFRVRELYLKRGDLDEAVRRVFSWLNAKVRLQDTRAVRVEYHTWWFHALLLSEERWETRFPITVNASSGTEVEPPDLLDLWEFEPHPAACRQPPPTYRQAARRAQLRLRELASGFLDRMEIPALAVDLSVQRKRAQRKQTVYWNPLLKQLEPICCSRCGRGTFSVAFTNEDVDPLCAKCSG